MKRRTTLLIWIAVVVAGAAALAAVAWLDTTRPVLRENTAEVSGISREVRILHVSDLHAARFGPGQQEIEGVLDGQRFDAAVITGDLLVSQGGDRTAAFDLVEVLERHADAVLFVPGNHDDDALPDQLSERGVVVIQPGGVVRTGAGDARLTFISADRRGRVDARVSVDAPLLVVASHQPPDAALLARARRLTRGAQVLLAGHTHGGQIRIPVIGAVLAPVRWEFGPLVGGPEMEWFPELRGIQIGGLRRSGTQLIEISPGLGTTVVPFRLFDPAELTVLRLVPGR